VYDFSIAKETHTVYNTYRFTTKNIHQILVQVYHIWWDSDKENRKPIKVGFNLGIIIESPERNSTSKITDATYKASKSDFQESFTICVLSIINHP
jgi:hypothetical protein